MLRAASLRRRLDDLRARFEPEPVAPRRSCGGTGGRVPPEPDCTGWVLGPSRPEGVSDEADAEGRASFERGVAAYQAGDYPTARTELLRAYEQSQRPAILWNVALATERLGDYREAEELRVELYQRLDPCDPLARQMRRSGFLLPR